MQNAFKRGFSTKFTQHFSDKFLRINRTYYKANHTLFLNINLKLEHFSIKKGLTALNLKLKS